MQHCADCFVSALKLVAGKYFEPALGIKHLVQHPLFSKPPPAHFVLWSPVFPTSHLFPPAEAQPFFTCLVCSFHLFSLPLYFGGFIADLCRGPKGGHEIVVLSVLCLERIWASKHGPFCSRQQPHVAFWVMDKNLAGRPFEHAMPCCPKGQRLPSKNLKKRSIRKTIPKGRCEIE
jgi:hypothetical protein